MLHKLWTSGIGPWKNFEFQPAEHLNIFTGDNGLGKTFILDIIWYMLARDWAHVPAIPSRSSEYPIRIIGYLFGDEGSETTVPVCADYNRTSQHWDIRDTVSSASSQTRAARPGLVCYLTAAGDCKVWDSYRNIYPGDELNWSDPTERERKYSFHFRPEDLLHGLFDESRKKVWCNGLNNDWLLWQLQSESLTARNLPIDTVPFGILSRLIETLSPPGEDIKPGIPCRVFLDDPSDQPTIETTHGTLPLAACSAGVKRTVLLAYMLTWAWVEHCKAAEYHGISPTRNFTFIVDEIEVHLHPRWQRRILPSLLQAVTLLSADLEVQIFATTHSPLVLASLEKSFSPKIDQLFLFKEAIEPPQDENRVELLSLPWAKQGDINAWLTSEAFGLSQARSIEAELAINIAHKFLLGKIDELPPNLKTKTDIHNYLKENLASLDPFWPRWVVGSSDAQI